MNEMRNDPRGRNSIKSTLEILVKCRQEKTRSLSFSSCMTVFHFPFVLLLFIIFAGPSKKVGAQPLPEMLL